MLRPKPLQPGDRLAVLGGSSPTSVSVEELTAAVRKMGLEPVLYPSATAKHGYLSGSDAMRAADINAAFADDSIQGIVTTRGGYGFHRILPLLDWKNIKKHPKLFGGYSDVTAMLTALNQICNMEACHMPMVGAWSGDGLDDYSLSFVKAMLFGEPVEYCNPEGQPLTTLVPGKAKGRLCGVMFLAALEHDDYLAWARHANEMADIVRAGMEKGGVKPLIATTTNQIFPIVTREQEKKLAEQVEFERWGDVDDAHVAIRFVTSWATTREDAQALAGLMEAL